MSDTPTPDPAPDQLPTDKDHAPADHGAHDGYTTPPDMRRRNIITGLTIITVVLLMIALAILLPTLRAS